MSDPVSIQRAYYAASADGYEAAHLGEDEHNLALRFMASAMDYYGLQSTLDIGSGTGRALQFLKSTWPDIKVVGIEPSSALREIGYRNGLSREELIDGDAQAVQFPDASFDLVCEFGALHHIPNPAKAVSEMIRVAKRGIFISDGNNFGQGSALVRMMKQTIDAFGLWKVADWFKTRGKGYIITEGDGLSYSYSVFNDWKQINFACDRVYLLGTQSTRSQNLYRGAGSVAILALKS